jgi:release factor glutamine methyltransferase
MRAVELVRAAAARIAGDTARLDAELLVAHALGLTREAMLLDNPVVDPTAIEPLIARRIAGEPVAYIIGRQEFWSLDLEVTRDVLIPRADSETLIVEALRRFPTDRPLHVLDLGTGSGALILATLSEWHQATGVATDASAAALAVARGNAERLGLARRCRFIATDWATGVDDRFDLILSNPPYVGDGEVLGRGVREFEPAGALFAGADGLDAYRRLLPRLPDLLAVAGVAIVEIGHAQAAAVLALGTASGLAGSVARDLAGRDRAIVFQAA